MELEASTSSTEVSAPSRPEQRLSSPEEAKVDKNNPHGLLPPKYFIKPELLCALSSVGADHKTYTTKEILGLLKAYLRQNYCLIDSKDTQFVNCGGTPLSQAFGVDRFQYNDVKYLLSRNVIRVIENAHQSHSLASSSQSNFKPICRSPIHIPIPQIPECQTGTETDYSYQGYETAYCTDSDDDLPASVSEENYRESGEDVEYEPATEEENGSDDSLDTQSDVENFILILDVDEQADSAEDCFADESDSMTERSGDLSEDEGDQWYCLACGIKNKPFVRYCEKCWQLRKDWYPEPPKKRKNRKPRPKKDKRRASLTERQLALRARADEDTETESKAEFVPAFSLQRDGSTASCSTQASTSSVGSSSQESGFCSQGSHELQVLSFEATMSSARKRKASEMDDDANGLVDDAIGADLGRRFVKFSSSANGRRWLGSSSAHELRKLLEEVSADSDTDQGVVDDRCTICYSRPKDASIIHGRISHIGFCYPCAKRLFKAKAKCPLCRRRIHMITKNAYV